MNQASELTPDFCVIGAGAAGLVFTSVAAQLGFDVVLLEKGDMGGDCLNVGCVPSKALLAAGARAQSGRDAARYGVNFAAPEIDFAKVMDHVRGAIAHIEPHDSQERFEGLGATVLREHGRFTGPDTVETESRRIRFGKSALIATGAGPRVPAVPGLDKTPFFTNETIWGLKARPEKLVIMGGGPIGMELAQAFNRLGSSVSVIEATRVFARDDEEAGAIVSNRLRAEGVEIVEGAKAASVSGREGDVTVTLEGSDAPASVSGTHLLVAVGRAAAVNDLGLEAAGVAYDRSGVKVDATLRTTNKKIFAAGDVRGGPQFTHMAGDDAAVVIRNAIFARATFFPKGKARDDLCPRVTYTDPELASVGLSETDARAKHGDGVRVLTWPFKDNDRAVAEGDTEGFLKVIADAKGAVLGVTIVGREAGELLGPWCIAMERGLKVAHVGAMIAPYPTRGEIAKRMRSVFYEPSFLSERTRSIARFLSNLP